MRQAEEIAKNTYNRVTAMFATSKRVSQTVSNVSRFLGEDMLLS